MAVFPWKMLLRGLEFDLRIPYATFSLAQSKGLFSSARHQIGSSGFQVFAADILWG